MLKFFTILALPLVVSLSTLAQVPQTLVPQSTLDPQTAPVPETQGDESLVMKLEREIAVLEALIQAQAQLNEDDLIRGRRLPLSLCLASPLKGDCARLGATFGEGEP